MLRLMARILKGRFEEISTWPYAVWSYGRFRKALRGITGSGSGRAGVRVYTVWGAGLYGECEAGVLGSGVLFVFVCGAGYEGGAVAAGLAEGA